LAKFFIVLAESSVTTDPGEGSLDNPSTTEDLESSRENRHLHSWRKPHASLETRLAHYLDLPSNLLLYPVHQSTLVAAIRIKQTHPQALVFSGTQQQPGTITILDVCRMNLHFDEEALRVREDMPLPTFDLLPRVVPAKPPFSVVLTD
jgi:hypothetical protein